MRKAMCVMTLILVLACPAHAGIMPNGDAEGTTSIAQGETQAGDGGIIPIDGTPGIMPNDGAGTPPQASTSNTLGGVEVTFSLMQSLLGLF